MPKPLTDASPAPVAFSYIRFSHPDQAKGDSLRRQTDAAQDWCRRHGARLDIATTFRDLGKSAFLGKHRKNPDRHALAAFLKLVEAGKVPRGSFLIIENLDRLSREHIRPALTLLLDLIEAGIRVIQLKPVEQVFDEDVEPMQLMMAIMELSRGHSESAIKSERVGSAWARKKREARESGSVVTHRLPAWVQEVGGKLQLIPVRAAAVKRIFHLAANGYGHAAIVKRFMKDKVPVVGNGGSYDMVYDESLGRLMRKHVPGKNNWVRSYVANILKDRRAVGEFRPRKRDGTPDGSPIANYFPAVVTEQEWLAARAAAAQRRTTREQNGRFPKRPAEGGHGPRRPLAFAGRPSKHGINVFAGLLRNSRDGSSYYCATRVDGHKPGRRGTTQRVLINTNAAEGRTECWSFPYGTFERALLSMLWEVNPQEVLGHEDGPEEAAVLAGELGRVRAKAAELEAELLNGDVAALAKVLRELQDQEAVLEGKLAEARQKAVAPLSGGWLEASTLMAALDSAPDPEEAQLRLRALLRRVIDSIWMVVMNRGRDRLAAVQLFFKGGGTRFYQILHRPPKGNKAVRQPGRWWASSGRCGSIDLREPEAVAVALEMLPTFAPDQLEAQGEWDRAGDLRRSGIIGQPDDPGWMGVPLGRPRRKRVRP
jgi:DNA invertase Pin-like site-specific DNA recombinase